jgi:hypothetical protein
MVGSTGVMRFSPDVEQEPTRQEAVVHIVAAEKRFEDFGRRAGAVDAKVREVDRHRLFGRARRAVIGVVGGRKQFEQHLLDRRLMLAGLRRKDVAEHAANLVHQAHQRRPLLQHRAHGRVR